MHQKEEVALYGPLMEIMGWVGRRTKSSSPVDGGVVDEADYPPVVLHSRARARNKVGLRYKHARPAYTYMYESSKKNMRERGISAVLVYIGLRC